MTDHATRARSILARLYFYGPEYWTGETDEAGLREKAQRQQEDVDEITAALDLAAQPVWSTNRPTVEGSYWFRCHSMTESVVQVYQHPDDGMCMVGPEVEHCEIAVFVAARDAFDELEHQDCEWAGPLPLPREA